MVTTSSIPHYQMTRSNVWHADNAGNGIISNTPVSVAHAAIRTTKELNMVAQLAIVINHFTTMVRLITLTDH